MTAFGAAYARRCAQIRRTPSTASRRMLPQTPSAPMFYTNFEIMNVSWFAALRSRAPFARAVDASAPAPEHTTAVDVQAPQDGDCSGTAGRRAAPVADARAFRGRARLLCFGGERDYRHRGPQCTTAACPSTSCRGLPGGRRGRAGPAAAARPFVVMVAASSRRFAHS